MPGAWIVKGLLLFEIFSFAGWMIECCCAGLSTGRLVNRGFLSGPYIPVYGLGSIVLLLVSRIADRILVLTPATDLHPAVAFFLLYVLPWSLTFIIACVLLSLLEYLVNRGLDAVLQARCRDYSQHKGNLSDRTCRIHAFCWGLLGLLLVRVIHPRLEEPVAMLPMLWTGLIAAVLAGCIAVDVRMSFRRAGHFRKIMHELEDFSIPYFAEMKKFEEEYEKKVEVFEKRKTDHRYGWRRTVEAASAKLRREGSGGNEAFQGKMEEANNGLRDALRLLKEELVESANERDAAVREVEVRFIEILHQAFGQESLQIERKVLLRVFHAFPAIRPIPPSAKITGQPEISEPENNNTDAPGKNTKKAGKSGTSPVKNTSMPARRTGKSGKREQSKGKGARQAGKSTRPVGSDAQPPGKRTIVRTGRATPVTDAGRQDSAGHKLSLHDNSYLWEAVKQAVNRDLS